MTDGVNDDYEYRLEKPPRSRALLWIVLIVVLAAAGIGSFLLWRSYGNGLPAFPSLTPAAESATPPDKPVGLTDFQAFQQQIVGSMQSTAQVLAAQDAEIKRLSDQVSALSANLDLLEHPLAQAVDPAAVPKPVAPAPKKKPAAPKPAGAISTGGAPLPLQSPH
ncbi:hypothetical protein [Bradyrhizobium sp.]|uniref:hypothetical protein n=1 Tax=Bradyrhizobium sp. TaxID=376 RepID=UPI0025C62199|nr:hypothetical protein [Bradyrhizobium sp.]